MKIANNYDAINWQQCREKLLRLQFEVLKAYKTNDKKNLIKIKYLKNKDFKVIWLKEGVSKELNFIFVYFSIFFLIILDGLSYMMINYPIRFVTGED